MLLPIQFRLQPIRQLVPPILHCLQILLQHADHHFVALYCLQGHFHLVGLRLLPAQAHLGMLERHYFLVETVLKDLESSEHTPILLLDLVRLHFGVGGLSTHPAHLRLEFLILQLTH